MNLFKKMSSDVREEYAVQNISVIAKDISIEQITQNDRAFPKIQSSQILKSADKENPENQARFNYSSRMGSQ